VASPGAGDDADADRRDEVRSKGSPRRGYLDLDRGVGWRWRVKLKGSPPRPRRDRPRRPGITARGGGGQQHERSVWCDRSGASACLPSLGARLLTLTLPLLRFRLLLPPPITCCLAASARVLGGGVLFPGSCCSRARRQRRCRVLLRREGAD